MFHPGLPMAALAAFTLATCSQAGSYPMPTASPKKQFFTLTTDDEVRLQRIAPLFDIQSRVDRSGRLIGHVYQTRAAT